MGDRSLGSSSNLFVAFLLLQPRPCLYLLAVSPYCTRRSQTQHQGRHSDVPGSLVLDSAIILAVPVLPTSQGFGIHIQRSLARIRHQVCTSSHAASVQRHCDAVLRAGVPHSCTRQTIQQGGDLHPNGSNQQRLQDKPKSQLFRSRR